MSAMASCLRPQLLLLLLLSAWLVADASPAGYPGRTRARAIRGFKNQALSTARGFGKRASIGQPLDLLLAPRPNDEASAAQASGDERESFPVEWIAEELQSNPDLARMIVHKFVDANQDGELTPDELLRP